MRRISQEQGEVAVNEVITIYATGLTSKLVVLEPQAKVRLPGVLWDIGRRLISRRGSCVEDVLAKSLGPRQVGARAPVFAIVVAFVATRMVAPAGLLSRHPFHAYGRLGCCVRHECGRDACVSGSWGTSCHHAVLGGQICPCHVILKTRTDYVELALSGQ